MVHTVRYWMTNSDVICKLDKHGFIGLRILLTIIENKINLKTVPWETLLLIDKNGVV